MALVRCALYHLRSIVLETNRRGECAALLVVIYLFTKNCAGGSENSTFKSKTAIDHPNYTV
jgi:hypothetical protein